MKKVSCLLFSIIMLLSIFCTAYAKEFPDVPKDHWAYQYVNELSEQGVINGYEDGTYQPNKEVTRAEFLKLIVSCVDEKNIHKANLVLDRMDSNDKDWYFQYYMSAVVLHLYSHTSQEVREQIMNLPITRQEMVTIIYNFGNLYSMFDDVEMEWTYVQPPKTVQEVAYDLGYIKDSHMDMEEFLKTYDALDDEEKVKISEEHEKQSIQAKKMEVPSIDKTFSDLTSVPFDGLIQLEKVYKIKLLNGYEDGTFKPEKGLTRAEVATVISRCLNMRKGVDLSK